MIFVDALENFEGHNRTITTAGIWATYPQPHVHNVTGFFDQVNFIEELHVNCKCYYTYEDFL